ncbi:MAG TPA: hypothetical protein DIS62_01465 [Candidatus Kerfeldbacteria bacterium]|nr:hypothetical protein [Candidatus Kerfeldbacteria bacterium]
MAVLNAHANGGVISPSGKGFFFMGMKQGSICIAVLLLISFGLAFPAWAGDSTAVTLVKQPSFVREWKSSFDSTQLSYHVKLGWGDAVLGKTHLFWAAWRNSDGLIFVEFSEILTAKRVEDLNSVRDTIGRPWIADHISVETSNEPAFTSRTPEIDNENCLRYAIDRIKRFDWCKSMEICEVFAPVPRK